MNRRDVNVINDAYLTTCRRTLYDEKRFRTFKRYRVGLRAAGLDYEQRIRIRRRLERAINVNIEYDGSMLYDTSLDDATLRQRYLNCNVLIRSSTTRACSVNRVSTLITISVNDQRHVNKRYTTVCGICLTRRVRRVRLLVLIRITRRRHTITR